MRNFFTRPAAIVTGVVMSIASAPAFADTGSTTQSFINVIADYIHEWPRLIGF